MVALPEGGCWLGVEWGWQAALQGEGLTGFPVLMGEAHWAVCAPFPPAAVCVMLDLIWARCLCSFQAKMGFLAFLSAVRQSLCGAEAVLPLAKRQEGHPPGPEESLS